MRRLVVATMLALALGVVTAVVVFADGGPHGDYNKTMAGATDATDKCAACHRVHQGQSAGYLLKKATQYELCVTCHDGTVSRLDVLDGVRLTNTVASRDVATVTNTALNGGGFEYVNGTAVSSKHNVRTSVNDPGQSNPWGYLVNTGMTNTTTIDQPLTCTSCHNPHGSANYRIIRETVQGYTVSVMAYATTTVSGGTVVITKQEGTRGLEAGAPDNKYIADYYASAGLTAGGFRGFSGSGYAYTGTVETVSTSGDASKNGFALLCGSCHVAYPSSSAKVSLTASGNMSGVVGVTTTTNYRHRTEMPYTDWNSPKYGNGSVPCNPETQSYNFAGGCNSTPGSSVPALRLASNTSTSNSIVTCLTCHRAHGTATAMTGFALYQGIPSGSSPDTISPAQKADSAISGGWSKSMLLFTDNRAMCEACHQW